MIGNKKHILAHDARSHEYLRTRVYDTIMMLRNRCSIDVRLRDMQSLIPRGHAQLDIDRVLNDEFWTIMSTKVVLYYGDKVVYGRPLNVDGSRIIVAGTLFHVCDSIWSGHDMQLLRDPDHRWIIPRHESVEELELKLALSGS